MRDIEPTDVFATVVVVHSQHGNVSAHGTAFVYTLLTYDDADNLLTHLGLEK